MKVLGLIGYPLGHSASKVFFTDKFIQENITDCTFELFPIAGIDLLPSIIHGRDDVFGLAVTKPYKESVIPFLDFIDEGASKIGAVNCLVRQSGRWAGYNTDAAGFEKSLLPILQPRHRKALVLGTGGASKAVQHVLKKNNIAFLTVSRPGSSSKGHIFYGQIDKQILDEHTIVINCTPLGMTPDEDACPDLPYQLAGEGHLFYDLIYKPQETLFMSKARSAGAMVKNGYDMFLNQAEENWKHWQDAIR